MHQVDHADVTVSTPLDSAGHGFDAVSDEPLIDVSGIESDVLADLVERNPALGHEAAHEPLRRSQALSQLSHTEKSDRTRISSLSAVSLAVLDFIGGH